MKPVDEFGVIKELIIQHKVSWEVWPFYHIDRKGAKIRIGFELELSGTHHDPKEPPKPDCAECVKVYNDLQRIAQWILPKGGRLSRYEIGIFNSSIYFSAKRKLLMRILHKGKFDDPTDDCEVRCLNEMEEKLKALGAEKY